MKSLLKILLSVLLSVPLLGTDNILIKETKKSDRNAIIFLFDNAGLNSFNSCSSLAKQNLDKYDSLIKKKALRKQRVKSVEYYVFNQQIKNIATIQSNRVGKLYRESKAVKIKYELKKDTTKNAKDVLSLFPFINTLVEQKYKKFTNVAIIVFSNLRDTVLSKKQRLELTPIKINEKVTLELFASSGLKCLNQTITTTEILSAEKSVIDYYNSKIDSQKLSIHTMY